MTDYTEALEANPRSAALYANRSLPLLKPQAARACGETDIRVPVIRSLALLKLRAFDEAEEDATAALDLEPSCVKATQLP